MKLHVSIKGNNNWNGFLPNPDDDGRDGPLKSIQEAILRIRQLRNQNLFTGTATVILHKGVYILKQPIRLGVEDQDLVFKAAEEETVTISGGTGIRNWQTSEVNGRQCWVADVSRELEFIKDPRSIYVNDKPRPRSRWPKKDWLVIKDVPDVDPAEIGLFDGSSRFVVNQGDFDPTWRNPKDIQAVINHLWIEERMPVQSYEPSSGLIRSSRSSIFCLRNLDWMGSDPCARYYWENVFEALAEPGEWYIDKTEEKLYYLPTDNETLDNTTIVLPHLFQIIRLHGDSEKNIPVRNIHFSNIQFAHTDWTDSEGFGMEWDPYTDASKWKTKDSFKHFADNLPDGLRHGPAPFGRQYAAMPQAAFDLPGAVSLEYAENCSFDNCRFSCLGFYAIDVRSASRNLAFTGNTIGHIGGGGIKADGSDAFGDPARLTGHLNISDNTIQNCGSVYASAVGIGLIHSGKNRIVHNEVSDLYYTGISVGWVWSFDENVSTENFIAHNHIHTIGQHRLSDMGGIYTLGRQPGTILHGNHIHDVYGTHYGGWGIYLDGGSSLVRVERNLVYRTGSQGLHDNGGRQNVYLDNVFALPNLSGIIISREEGHGSILYPPKGTLFMRNVILTDGKSAFKDYMTYLDAGVLVSDLNLYWDFQDKKDTIIWDYDPWPEFKLASSKLLLNDTKARGLDLHSRVQDPKFGNPQEGDFTVSKHSPVHRLGIQLPDASLAGPRAPKDRVLVPEKSSRHSQEIVFGD